MALHSLSPGGRFLLTIKFSGFLIILLLGSRHLALGAGSSTLDWLDQFGSAGNDYGRRVALHSSGVYVAGYTSDTIPGQTPLGGNDVFVRKYDPDGTELWTRQFGTTARDESQTVAVDNSGVYVAGYTEGGLGGPPNMGAGFGAGDAFLRKYDHSGLELWTRQFGTVDGDMALDVATDGAAVYVSGWTGGSFTGHTSAGGVDAFVQAFDLDGNDLWRAQVGSASHDEGAAISADGAGVYLFGHTTGILPGQTSAGGRDVFLQAFDLNGSESWTRQFGSGSGDEAMDVVASGSTVYVSGAAGGALPGQQHQGGLDAFVRAYDASGVETWTHQFGSFTHDIAYGLADNGAALYVVGYSNGALPGQSSSGNADVFARKLSHSGAEQWTTQFGTSNADFGLSIVADGPALFIGGQTYAAFPDETHAGNADTFVAGLTDSEHGEENESGSATLDWTSQSGGSGSDFGRDIVVAGSALYVTGYSDGSFDGQPHLGNLDAILRRQDTQGNVIWTRQFGTDEPDLAETIAVYGNALYVAGYTGGDLNGHSNAGGLDAFVHKFDLDGNEIWVRQFGSGSGDQALGIAADASGVYVSGRTEDVLPGQSSAGGIDAFVRRYDHDGIEVWTQQFGTAGIDYAQGVALDGGNLYVGGWTTGAFTGQTSSGGTDSYVRKMDLSGNETWTRQFGTVASDFGLDLVAGNSAVYISGWTGGALPGQSSPGGNDAYLRKYDDNGVEVWTRQFGSSGNDAVNGVTLDANGVYVAGTTQAALANQTHLGGNDVIVRSYDLGGGQLWTAQFGAGNHDIGWAVAANGSAAFVTGHTADALPGHTSAGANDLFVAKLLYGLENRPPLAHIGGPYDGFEGAVLTLDGSASSDADGDSLTYRWTVDSALCTFSDANVQMPTLTCADDGSFSVTLEVDDGQAADVASTTVHVHNAEPALSAITTAVDPIPVNASITASAVFSDAGVLDSHTAVWEWADGATSAGTVSESNGVGSVSDTYTYTSPGVYTVVLTVADDDGGFAVSTYRYVVVYDPDGGFVTGAGWIESPGGACQLPSICIDVEGKAHFGFVSKYNKGADRPAGNTHFRLISAGLLFESDAYDWLVVNQSGSNAQFKGTGIVNGTPAPGGELYKFQIWAGDGNGPADADTYRIKIWYDDGGAEVVVYDNGSQQPISTGQIKVHK